ncbi:hypothetical protein [Caudoviricetes sp.]|nr:hypothetical protein [Caudoviricetes sp.]
MTIFDFERAIKKLSKKFWINFNQPVSHPQYPQIKLIGLWFDKKHLGSLTLDTFIPPDDIYDKAGILTHRGIKSLLKFVCSVEWVPTKGRSHPKEHQGHYFKAEFMRSKLKEAFGITEAAVLKP